MGFPCCRDYGISSTDNNPLTPLCYRYRFSDTHSNPRSIDDSPPPHLFRLSGNLSLCNLPRRNHAAHHPQHPRRRPRHPELRRQGRHRRLARHHPTRQEGPLRLLLRRRLLAATLGLPSVLRHHVLHVTDPSLGPHPRLGGAHRQQHPICRRSSTSCRSFSSRSSCNFP